VGVGGGSTNRGRGVGGRRGKEVKKSETKVGGIGNGERGVKDRLNRVGGNGVVAMKGKVVERKCLRTRKEVGVRKKGEGDRRA